MLPSLSAGLNAPPELATKRYQRNCISTTGINLVLGPDGTCSRLRPDGPPRRAGVAYKTTSLDSGIQRSTVTNVLQVPPSPVRADGSENQGREALGVEESGRYPRTVRCLMQTGTRIPDARRRAESPYPGPTSCGD